MVRVVTTVGDVSAFTGGQAEFEVAATTIGELFQELEARYPGLGDFAERRMAVAVDGVIHQDALWTEIGGAREVCLIPKIGGG